MKSAITQAGITLVALVVTIVVLLILAGITITYVFSDNGILSQAQSAANKTDAATVLEEIQQRLLAIQAGNKGSYTNDDVQTVVAEVIGKEKDDIEIGVEIVTTENGNEVDISGLWVDGTSTTTTGWYYDDDRNVTNGTITLEIGDYVDYTSETVSYTSTSDKNGYGDYTFSDYTETWQVLGVAETTGEILLISSSLVGSLYLYGQVGYENCETELEYIGSLYANGTGASSGRSVTVEDINKVTGYNPNNVGVNDPDQTGTGTKYSAGYLYEYGNTVTYYWQGTNYPYYSATNGLTGTLRNSHNVSSYGNSFYWYDESYGWLSSGYDSTATTSGMKEITTLTSDDYFYYPATLTSSSSGDVVGLSTESTAYSMLFGTPYWLESRTCDLYSGYVRYGCRGVLDGGLIVEKFNLFFSEGSGQGRSYGVRSVVSLEADIALTQVDSTHWSIS